MTSADGAGRRGGRLAETRADLGWIASVAASAYLTIATFLAANVLPLQPFLWTLALGLPIGVLLLTPREKLARLALDVPLMLILAWMALSATWSLNQGQAIFEVRRDVTLIAAVSLMAGLVPAETAAKAVIRAVYAALAVTVVALVLLPETRTHSPGDLSLYSQAYPGWHGLFIHKNVMAPFFVFGAATIALFEEHRGRKTVALATILVLLIGSQSATGLAGAGLVLALHVWFRFYHRTRGRSASAYVAGSAAVAICGLIAAMFSVSAITSAYGKDLTFSGRTEIWSAAVNAFVENPWVGYGLGGVFWTPPNEVTRTIWREVGFVIPHAHNGVLDVALTLGIVGVVLFFIKFVSTINLGVQLLPHRPVVAEWILTITAAQLLMGLSEVVFTGDWLVYAAILRAVGLKLRNEQLRASRAARASANRRGQLIET